MGKIGGFQINFYKSISHKSESDKLTVGEQFEVGEKATFYIESLVFFITASGRYALEEIDSDGYTIHLENVGEIIGRFTSVVRESLSELDERRIKLEEIVKKLPTVKQTNRRVEIDAPNLKLL